MAKLISNIKTNFSHRAYMLGYRGRLLPRFIRRFLAKTSIHRGWLAGHMFIYSEDGYRYGVCDRMCFCYR